jgi:hypothetical protein
VEAVEALGPGTATRQASAVKNMSQMHVLTGTILAVGLGFGIAGCGFSLAPLPAGSIAGRAGIYDYSPSVIQSGNLQQAWWCGGAYNPPDTTYFSDTIQYQSIDLSTGAHYGPVAVLGETPGAWDSVFTCNPKVVQGSFTNPLGDGENFTYAMYYVGLGPVGGTNNSIGVAFSNDGISWKKYPHPVISPETEKGYGVGQPAAFNSDHRAAIWVFYEDDSFYPHHTEAKSSDGVHFVVSGTLTTNGLDPNSMTWGDMARDPDTGYWYAGFNTPTRDPLTTGGVLERGSWGIELYRISDDSLLTGATPWELLGVVDTNLTGYEANFLPGLVRDMYGDLLTAPSITMYASISNPPPPWDASPAAAGTSGTIPNWNIASFTFTQNPPLAALNRYVNQTVHEVTTGWIDPKGGFSLQSTLGHLYPSPQLGATVPFYGCKSGSMDYFVSLDSVCEGARILGTNGYAYAGPVAGLNLIALYRCSSGHDHLVSPDAQCEGQTVQELLGYVLP